MCEQERLALFHFWREVGGRMGIREIPETYAAFERYNVEYERVHFKFAESNRHIGAATRELFAGWFPPLLRPVVRHVIYALLDEPVRHAFAFPKALPGLRACVVGALKLRALALRFMPARRHPRLRTQMTHPSYPAGYQLDQIGPAYMTQATAPPSDEPQA